MKKYLFLLLVAAWSVQTWAQGSFAGMPISLLGVKGKVSSIECSEYALENNNSKPGYIQSLPFYDADNDEKCIHLSSVSGGVYKGWDKSSSFSIHTANGKITKITYDRGEGGWKGTYTFTYANNSLTINESSSLTEKTTYTIDHTEEMERLWDRLNNYHYLYGMKLFGISNKEWRDYQNTSNRLTKLQEEDGKIKTKTTKKTYTSTVIYKDFVRDEFGNVVSYSKYISGVNANKEKFSSSTTNNTINYTYTPHYWSEAKWNKIKDCKDLSAVEQFYNDKNCSLEYKEKAATLWNTLAMEEAGNSKDTQVLLKYMANPILSKVNYNKIHQTVGEIYYPHAVKSTDCSVVRRAANMKVGGVSVFNEDFRQKILARGDELCADSVRKLNVKAETAYGNLDYQTAKRVAANALSIDPKNEVAANTYYESSYELVKKNIEHGNEYIRQLETLLKEYPTGKHQTYLEDAQIKYHLDKTAMLPASEQIDELNKIKRLPTSNTQLKEEIDNRLTRATKTIEREKNKAARQVARKDYFGGSKFGGGIGCEIGGTYALGGYGEIGTRIGSSKYLCNLYLGAHIGNITAKPEEKNGVRGNYFRHLRIGVPLQLRFNLVKDEDVGFYLGGGVDFNFNLNSKLISRKDGEIDADHTIKDKNIVTPIVYSPRLSLGVTASVCDLELYFLYDANKAYNVDYLETTNYKNLMLPETYEKQLKNRFRFGVAFRFLF